MEILVKAFSDIISQIISNAEKLGALSGTAIWAFFTIVLLAYIVWTLRNAKQASELAWQARMKDAESDDAMANAVEKLAEQVKELRYSLKCIGGK